eukprot:CAMPEP_0196762308 /NCGR_PEP_ID=MMETSP1095-20130614/1709_1 /TAXON_ID=96789 ORGANISM="Chromulina nebulosa, Strain UTEXLB2642" /NCGR_SAMPLE_ID=MMETSP1095 /ASSEMBLY_ACC=CAM_ASM_000446 /LENGTH=533 /DNA_ID=CAMNT_0042112921 /DNA_START=523 /DNA_END=2121 /DNA_ORIENTATION=+
MSYQNNPMIPSEGGYSIGPNIPRSNLINEQGYYGNPMGLTGNHLAQDQRYAIPMAQQPVLVQLPQQQYYTSNPQMVHYGNYHQNSGPMYAPNGQLSNLTNTQFIRPFDNRSQYFPNTPMYPGGNIQGTIHQHQPPAPIYTNGVIPGQMSSNIQLVGHHPQPSGPYTYQQIPPNIDQRDYVYQHNQPLLITPNGFMVPPTQIAIPSIIPNHSSQNVPNYQQANNFPTAASNNVINNTTVAPSSNINNPTAEVTAPKRKQLVVLDKEGKIFDHGKKPTTDLPTNKTDGDIIKSEDIASKISEDSSIDKNTNSQVNETLESIESVEVENNSTDSTVGNVVLNDLIPENNVETSIDIIDKISSGIDNISLQEDEKTNANQTVVLTETTNVLNLKETINTEEVEINEQISQEIYSESATATFEEKDDTTVSQVIPSSTFSEIPVYINPVVHQPSSENNSWRSNSSDRKSSSPSVVFNNKSLKKSDKNKNDYKESGMLDAYTPTVIKPVEVIVEKSIDKITLSEPQVVTSDIIEEPENW